MVSPATHRVPQDGIRCWKKPHPNARMLDRLPGGLAVRIEESRGEWARVTGPGGEIGWVAAKELERLPPPPPPSPPTAAELHRTLKYGERPEVFDALRRLDSHFATEIDLLRSTLIRLLEDADDPLAAHACAALLRLGDSSDQVIGWALEAVITPSPSPDDAMITAVWNSQVRLEVLKSLSNHFTNAPVVQAVIEVARSSRGNQPYTSELRSTALRLLRDSRDSEAQSFVAYADEQGWH